MQCSDRTGPLVPPSYTAGQQGVSQPAGGSTNIPTPPPNTKLPGQRAYLQSLDRSSRAWVLSSGKSQCPDEVGPRDDVDSNIWYNPIPEEEESDPWRRRDDGEVWVGSAEGQRIERPLEEPNPSVCYPDDITAENPGEAPP